MDTSAWCPQCGDAKVGVRIGTNLWPGDTNSFYNLMLIFVLAADFVLTVDFCKDKVLQAHKVSQLRLQYKGKCF